MNKLKIFKQELNSFLPIFFKAIPNIRLLVYKDYREFIFTDDEWEKLSFSSFWCRMAGHPYGEIYYTTNVCATEPNHRCKYCNDYIG